MPDLLERLQSALAERYAVESEIGSGGMATVYLAEDLKHRRKVAIKVLHPSLAETVGADRFLAEIETVAALNHPHVLPLYDSGEADGLLFYVMPYVKGESLRQRLDRERQLPVNEATRLAAEIADGLDYAHRQGVVHRDIKPGNVLLSEGHAVLADFGIARAITVARAERMTGTGIGVGTPLYASPEQASGDETLDGRTDIYSLGCVLYEMLSGEVPLYGATPQSIQAKRLSETPTSLVLLRDTVPQPLDGAVARALAKVPADRWATAGEFKEALETSRLSATPGMTSPPFGVSASAPGVAASAGLVRWKRRVPAWLLVVVPVAVAAAVYTGMNGGFGSGEPSVPTAAERIQARDLGLEGEDALNGAMTRAATRSDTEFLFREAAEKFQAATDLDPSRAESYAGLVLAYAYLGSWGFLTYEETFPLMSAAAEKAMALDSLSAPVQAAMGYMSGLAEREYEQSLAHFLRAYELEPGHQNAPIWKNNAAAMLTDLGRPDEAMSLVRATAGFDSIGWDRETLVELLVYSDRYEEALTEAQHAIVQGADTARMNWRGSKALIELGRFDEALVLLETLTSATAQRRLAQLHARSGEPELALRLVLDARAQSATHRMYSGRSDEAKVYAWLGDAGRALDLLEAEFAERGYIFYLPSDPAYRPLRQEPRFVRLLARTGLSCSFAEIGHTCRPM